jgi:Rrf2 family transcriptional regulator, iron-sulfur cluster assembly transcription factor
MRLTTKGRYAVTAMLDIALHHECGPVSVADVAERQAISGAYLEQLFGKLKRAGLLRSVRGPGGGYELAQPLDAINVSQIVAAVGEGVDATRCQGTADCHDGATCLTHDLWTALSDRIDDFLSGITLQTLVAQRHGQHTVARQDSQLIAARIL